MSLVTITKAGVAGVSQVSEDAFTQVWQPGGWVLASGAIPAIAPYLHWRDAWSSSTTYYISDVVSYLGVLYVALGTSTGVTPGTDITKWKVFMAAGGAITLDAVTALLSVFDVRSYGATGNGTTDDTAAIQAAINAAQTSAAATGNSVRVVGHPEDTYLINTWHNPGTGHAYALLISRDNVTLDLQMAKIKSTVGPTGGANGYFILVDGAGKIGDPSDFSTTWYPSRPMVNLTGTSAKGQMSVSVASGATFAAGDIIYIRTGNTLPIPDIYWPDSEINEIASVSGTTLNLKYPLTKPYAQEYYITGTSGLTSTAITANAAPYGVHRVTDCTLRNVVVRNVRFDTPVSTSYWAFAMQGINVTFENLSGNFGTCATGMQYTRSTRQRNYHATKVTPDLSGSMVAGWAVGASDGLIENVRCYGVYPSMFHIHEGVTSSLVQNCVMQTGNSTGGSDSGGVDIRARSYDLKVIGNDLTGGTINTICVVDSSCTSGGLIMGNRFHATTPGVLADMAVTGTGWQIVNNSGHSAFAVGAGNLEKGSTFVGVAPLDGFFSRYALGASSVGLGTSTTPTVSAPFYQATNSSPTTITHLLGGTDGQIVTILFVTANVTLQDFNNGGHFVLAGGTNWNPTGNSMITLRYINPSGQDLWYELSRTSR